MEFLQRLKHKLNERFCPTHLEIKDNSHLHAGHAAAKQHGGGHYAVVIVSDVFNAHSRIARHKLVYSVLEEAFEKDIHALQIQAFTQEEWQNKQERVLL